jgi:hypothetical protein
VWLAAEEMIKMKNTVITRIIIKEDSSNSSFFQWRKNGGTRRTTLCEHITHPTGWTAPSIDCLLLKKEEEEAEKKVCTII